MSEEFLFGSSRAQSPPRSFSAALLQGLAPDGGLYVPLEWPQLTPAQFAGASELPQVAERLLAPLLAHDRLAAQLPAIAREALDFPAPLVALEPGGAVSVLELFHGPTAAF